MKELILSNGQKIEVEDESYPLLFVVNVPSYSYVDELKNIITEENINGAQMDGMNISNVKFVTMQANLSPIGVRVEFLFREKYENEIMEERISELEDAVNFLLMGGEE